MGEVLISAVFKGTPLWNQKEKNHHNRYVLDKLWAEVSKETNIPGKDVRAKWKNLRDKFREELKKQPKPRSGDGAGDDFGDDREDGGGSNTQPEKTSSWKHFEALRFLTEQFTPRKASGNLEHIDASLLDPDEELLFEDSQSSGGTAISAPGASASKKAMTEEGYDAKDMTKETPRKKKQKMSDTSTDYGQKLLDLEEKKLSLIAADFEKKQPDENMAFFESLLPHVKKLSDEQQMLLQMEIQQVVYRHVYKQGSTSHSKSIDIHAQEPYPGSRTLPSIHTPTTQWTTSVHPIVPGGFVQTTVHQGAYVPQMTDQFKEAPYCQTLDNNGPPPRYMNM